MGYRLPFFLVMPENILESIEQIKKMANPKLPNNNLINRCIKFTEYVFIEALAQPEFKKSLDRMLVTNDFKKFFFRGGL